MTAAPQPCTLAEWACVQMLRVFSRTTFAQQNPGASAAQPTRPANIDRNGTLILIRTTLIALDQANKTGNYSVLHALGAPGFQATNSPQRLAEIFARQRAQGLDLAGVVAIDPQLTLLPQIEPSCTCLASFRQFRLRSTSCSCSRRSRDSGNRSEFRWTCGRRARRRRPNRKHRRSRSQPNQRVNVADYARSRSPRAWI